MTFDAAGAFTAGILTSAGPCAAPRFAATVSLTGGKTAAEACKLAAAFCCGLLLAYASFAGASWILQGALQNSEIVYAVIAGALAIGGFVPLVRSRCAHLPRRQQGPGASGAFVLGASMALVVSPCCAPVLLALSAYAAQFGNAGHGALLVVCYAAGHALPLIALGFAAHKVASVFTALANARATILVTSAVMLALAGYYAVLA